MENKFLLRDIAKIFAANVIRNYSGLEFDNTKLSDEGKEYIYNQVLLIADKISTIRLEDTHKIVNFISLSEPCE